jgi:LPS O-antigen subunit length determinant protein (WzzB/FepE family)
MNDMRAMLEEAFRQDDEAKAACEQSQRRIDALMQKQRSAPDELVYKTHWPTEREVARPQPQQTVMDQQIADGWNRWLAEYVARAIKQYDEKLSENLIDAVGEAFSIERGDMRKYISEQLGQLRKELETEIGGLRADVTLDRALKRGEVSQLHGEVPKKRRSDVA